MEFDLAVGRPLSETLTVLNKVCHEIITSNFIHRDRKTKEEEGFCNLFCVRVFQNLALD